jgi:methanogenic corrinoid protein MtbC1
LDLLAQLIDTGAGGISFDQCMELLAIEDRVPKDVAIIGNLDPVEIVAMAPPDAVAAATRELAITMGIRPNFVLSTGCALPPTTPLTNIVRFIESGRDSLAMMQSHGDRLSSLATAVASGDEAATIEAVKQATAAGLDPLLLLKAGLVRPVRQASARYEAKQCYLPEILLTVDAFYQGLACSQALMPVRKTSGPQVILGTVRGDLHAIGKDLVRIMLEVDGFSVLDLGEDVHAEKFVAAVMRQRPAIVGLSAFVTSARIQLPALIDALHGAGVPGLQVVVGGAAVNAAIAVEVGADGFAREAVSAIKLVRRLTAGGNGSGHDLYA